MATCDHPSDLAYRVGYPVFVPGASRVIPRSAALRSETKQQLPVPFNLDGKALGDIFYMVDSRPRNPWAAIGSLALMSVLVLAMITIPLLHTDPLPKREMLTLLYLQPPPAAAAASVIAPRTATPKSPYIPKTGGISAPVRETQEAPATAEDTAGGVVGGVAGGVIGGVPGGVLSQVLASTGSAPALVRAPEPALKRVHLAARVEEANLIHDVTPTYPAEAGRARIEGTVVLLAVIGKDGSVQDVRVESGLPILAQAAIDAVKQWRYRPYLLNGEPVEVDSRITINFTLSS